MNNTSGKNRVEAIYDQCAPDWDKRQGLVERVLMGEEMRRSLANELHGDVLAEARNAAQRTGRETRLAQMNAEALAFPDATFDTVTTSLMLCTVPNPTRALSEMSRVCKPDGRIVMLEHVRSPNRFVAKLQQWMTPAQVRQLGCHLDRPTDQLVRELDFRVERDKSRFVGVFHLMVVRPQPRPSAGIGNDALG